MLQWLVVLPPLLVIATVLLTRRMILAFLVGITCSALIAAQGNLIDAASLIIKRFMESTGLHQVDTIHHLLSNWSLAIFVFLLCIGSLLVLLQRTGAATVYGHIIKKHVKSRKNVEIASLALSPLFFIDDYFSALTVGAIMRPLALMYGLHPVKLAFLVTAMATPLTILAPISSWLGEIILQFKQVGIGTGTNAVFVADQFSLFLRIIPFMLYPIFIIIGTWYIVLRGISYGPMKKYDHAEKHPVEASVFESKASVFDFFMPIVLLVTIIITGLLYTGQFYLFGGTNTFIEAVKGGLIHQALLAGGLITLAVSALYFLFCKKITPSSVVKSLRDGSTLMLPSIIMLIHAWTLGKLLTQDLNTGVYIASSFALVMHITLLPTVCFLLAGLISWMIGSAWATIGLMLPLIVPMVQTVLNLPPQTPIDLVPLIIPILGATLSGCVVGSHLSLISDNPIMSAASTGADHFEHVKTMAWYVTPIALATVMSYILIGILMPYGLGYSFWISLMGGILSAILLLEVAQKWLVRGC